MSASAVHRSARSARRLLLTVPLAAALATGLSACADPAHRSADGAAASTDAGSTVPSSAGAPPSPSASPSKLNGTAGTGLTVSDGTKFVVMDGKLVDFGTEVHDLAWSPDGKHAAFVDGAGNLVVSAPDGTSRTTVAKNPGGQVWTHPTWQVSPKNPARAALNNIIFAAETNGVLRLMTVKSDATEGTPEGIRLEPISDPDVQPLPQTGNLWPSADGDGGSAVYANRRSGEVFIRDENLRQNGYAVAKGAEPALSPDGLEVVFVRAVDGHQHLFRKDSHASAGQLSAVDLTPKATIDYSAPVFSRDGKTVAARTDKGIVTLPADGSAAPTPVSEYTGTPAYRG